MTEQNNQRLGDRLLELRTKHNLTQEDLAEKLNVSRQSISKWELDKTLPDVEKMIQLATLYQVSLDYLVLGQKDETEESDVLVATDVVDTQKDMLVEKLMRGILLTGMTLAALISLVFLGVTVKLLGGYAWNYEGKEPLLLMVERVQDQYTKAEVIVTKEDGTFVNKTVWLDIPGVREGDFIQYYEGKNDTDTEFTYYGKTLVMPIICSIVFLIFALAFFIAWRLNKGIRRVEHGKEE